jgi:hypothetical protein
MSGKLEAARGQKSSSRNTKALPSGKVELMKLCALILAIAAAGFGQTDKPAHYVVFFISAEMYKDGSAHEKALYLSGRPIVG